MALALDAIKWRLLFNNLDYTLWRPLCGFFIGNTKSKIQYKHIEVLTEYECKIAYQKGIFCVNKKYE